MTDVYIETFADIRFYVKNQAGQQISMKPFLDVGNKVVFEGLVLFKCSVSTGSLYFGEGFTLPRLERFLVANGFTVVKRSIPSRTAPRAHGTTRPAQTPVYW